MINFVLAKHHIRMNKINNKPLSGHFIFTGVVFGYWIGAF